MPSDSHSKSPHSASSSQCTSCGEPMSAEHVCKNPFQNLIGTTIDGRYAVKGILGQGGMGVVFQATQTSMNRDVALKMLHPTLSSTPQFAERFRREAEVVSRLKHPSIISIFDFGQTPQGAFYYTMEMLEGENLKALVKRDGPMSVSRAVNIVEQVGEALSYAHSQGILHRDMKPHNVMCARFKGRDHVKVLDFGLVKMVDEEGGEEHLTTTGQILGTPAYMSPEQAGGDPLDGRSDLYSLGVVLYYLLAGSTPFKASSAHKLLQQAMMNEIPMVATRRKGAPIPGELDMFFRRALAFDKENRPADIESFLAELHASLNGVSQAVLDAVPEGAVAPAPETRTSTGMRRMTGGTGIPVVAEQSVAASSTSKAMLIGGGVGLLAVAGMVGAFFAMKRAPQPEPVPVAVATPQPTPQPVVPAQPTPPPPSANVSVHVVSDPAGAQVFDGATLLGTTPANLLLPRARSAVNLIVKHDGFLPQTQGVDLAGATQPVELTLKLAADPAAATKPDDKSKSHPNGKKQGGKVDVPIFE
ncbi:MAG: serine/threonine protein kinase [Deltaproteobacteria bacterium]|nr:serine/threonine protein kinase [Deltaproteobacteria bacterium]